MNYFRCWTDEEMTQPLTELFFSTFLEQSTERTGFFYFGCKEKWLELKTEQNQGIDNIEIFPFFNLPTIAKNTRFEIGDCNDHLYNGYIYRLTTAGLSPSSLPTFSTTIGTTVTCGTAKFLCVSKAHTTAEVKLALSEEDLTTAVAGAPLSLGNTIDGGIGVPIFYAISDSVDNPFDDRTCPQLCLSINNCIEINKFES